jgi:hypothetical protein
MTLAVLAIVATSFDFAYGAKAEDDAINCAKGWLSLVDGGLFAESWKAAGPYMQRAFPSGWDRKLDTVRKPLGEVVSRKLKAPTSENRFNRYPMEIISSCSSLLCAFSEVEEQNRDKTVEIARRADGAAAVTVC